jgi:SAM-dependent methyltransferase
MTPFLRKVWRRMKAELSGAKRSSAVRSPYSANTQTSSRRDAIGQQRLRALAADIGSDWRSHGYYERAEAADWLEPFWGQDSPFRVLFGRCDPSNTLEIACGHGRHTAQLLREHPNSRVTVQDINEENINAVVRRFAGDDRVTATVGNGYDLTPLPDSTFSFVFSYDAMVHFDDEVVFSYCEEIERVLQPGGRALLHHSNWTGTPGSDYKDNPSSRNFMSYRALAHRAKKNGLAIVEQIIIPWSGRPAIDAISLLEKPRSTPEPRKPDVVWK